MRADERMRAGAERPGGEARPLAAAKPEEDGVGGGWLIVYTAPQAERAVQGELDALFDTYAPLSVEWAFVTVRRKRVVVRRPLFPRYVFIRETAESRADGRSVRRIVRHTDGAIDLLASMDVPLRAPHASVSAIMRAERGGLFDRTRTDPRDRFRPGVPVTLSGGLWHGTCGIVAAASPRKSSVRIEVCEAGRTRLLDVPLDILRLVEG